MATSKGNGKTGSTGNKKNIKGSAGNSSRSSSSRGGSSRSSASRSNSSGTGSSGKAAKITEKRRYEDNDSRTVKGRTVREVKPVKEPRVLTKEEESVRNEIILTITALVSVLIILSFFNICGVVGKALNSLLFGTMGTFAYAFPVVLFFFMAFSCLTTVTKLPVRRFLQVLLFCSFSRLFFR